MIDEEFDFTDPNTLRKKAEEKLMALEKSSSELEEEVDLKKLLHELQVHQIELEMQNDELVHAYGISEAALKKYTLIYDLAPAGFFILDADGSICDLNFTGADLLGDRRFSLLKRNFKLFIDEGSLPEFNHFLNQVYESNAKLSCELNMGYNGQKLGMVYVEGVVTGDDQKCLLSVIDLSLLKK